MLPLQAIHEDGRVGEADNRDSHVFACMRLLVESVQCNVALVEERARALAGRWSSDRRGDTDTPHKSTVASGFEVVSL
jgi:hypothetical protein